MRREAIILAGGSGTRAGGEMPKQFVELLGIPMLWWSVRAFHDYDPSTAITIVMHPGFFDLWDILYAGLPEADRRIPVRLVCGGRDRSQSVENGLMGIENLQDVLVAVHDAARPLLSRQLVARCWDTAGQEGSAVPCCPEVNSLRRVSDQGTVPMDRDGILVVQTPQMFRGDWLEDAYRRRQSDATFTDDASLVQSAGYPVTVCDGDPANIKVTTPVDFTIARALMQAAQNAPAKH